MAMEQSQHRPPADSDEDSPSTSASASAITEPLNLTRLASLRPLLINPSTPQTLISSILKTLTRHLQLTPSDPLLLHHILHLLTELSNHHPRLSPFIFDLIRTHALNSQSTRIVAASLHALASIAENNPSLVPSLHEIDDEFFVSLCFSPVMSVRLWFLRSYGKFQIRPSVLFTLFSGFSKDPYPYVREAALDGLVELGKARVFDDRSIVEGCYYLSVELLDDVEAYVRSAAVRSVSEWGRMLVTLSNQDAEKSEWSDALFIQLCCVARDMSMEVRVQAFDALGKIEMVSRDLLLQSLSKKVLGNMKGRQFHIPCYKKRNNLLASSFAGALMHGLEDEFQEVRKTTCLSIRSLSTFSSEFADESINWLIIMLNDDSVAVRLQALDAMCHMATYGHYIWQVEHMDMFLGALADISALVRAAARKVLNLMKLPNLELFKLSIYGLTESLEKYPQDETEIFKVLFHIGKMHEDFVVSIADEISKEVEPASDGRLSFDCARVTAFLVLAISAPFSSKCHACKIPPRVFFYSVSMLGRISHALGQFVNQNTLLAHLSHCSKLNVIFNIKEKETSPIVMKDDTANLTRTEENGNSGLLMGQEDTVLLTGNVPQVLEQSALTTFPEDDQQEIHDEVIRMMNRILAKVRSNWHLINLGYGNEVLRYLRVCNEEVMNFMLGLVGSPLLLLAGQYLQMLKLLVEIWGHLWPPASCSNHGMGQVDLLLEKLEHTLKRLKCKFIGLSKEEELHLFELILVCLVLKLVNLDISSQPITVRKLSSVLLKVEILEKDVVEPSSFITELKKLTCVIGSDADNILGYPTSLRKVLDHFFLKQYELSGRIKSLSAELVVPDNNSENPLTFVPGLPVSVQFVISLHNVLRENRLWLKMMIGEESKQFVFLDFKLYDGSDELRKFTCFAPYYRTPKTISFTLRAQIAIEGLFEDISASTRSGGPKHELIPLSPEIEVFLSATVANLVL